MAMSGNEQINDVFIFSPCDVIINNRDNPLADYNYPL